VTETAAQRERAELPAKMEAAMAGVTGGARTPVLDSPFPLAPETFMASPAAEKPSPPSAPPSNEPPYKLPDVPPLPAFKEGGYKNGHHLAEPAAPSPVSEVNRMESVLPITDFPNAKTAPAGAPASPPKGEQNIAIPGVPVWPGLDLDEAASQAADAPPPAAEPPSPPDPVVAPVTKAPVPAAPVRRGSAGSKLALAAILLVGAGWLAWQRTHIASPSESIPDEPIPPALVTAGKPAGPIRTETPAPAKPTAAPSGQTIPPPAVASKLPTVAAAPTPIAPTVTPKPSMTSAPTIAPNKPEVAALKPQPVQPLPPKVEAPKPDTSKPTVAAVKPETPRADTLASKPEASKPTVATAKPEAPKVETPKPIVPAVKPEAPKPAEVAKADPPKPFSTSPSPLEVTRPAQPALAPLSEAVLQEAAIKSATVLNASTPVTDKLSVIFEPGRHIAEIEQFFKAHPSLGAEGPEASSGKVVVLPGGEDAKVFRMVTKSCPEGALLYFHNGGKALLDWPLFKQSHDNTYDGFVTNPNNAVAPQWFSALCRRTHTTVLKGDAKAEWISLEAQGSLTNAGAAVVYVDKKSAAGRYLDQKLTWERIYLVNLRLGKKIIEGQSVNVILDCDGTKP
jgi:hypothetical protein